MSHNFLFDEVFVLGAEMYQLPNGEFTFLEADQNGYIGGQLRIDAARLLIQQKFVEEIFCVGGPTRKENVEKSPIMAKMIGGNTKPLLGTASTKGNFDVIENFYRDRGGQHDDECDGILSHSFHFQRIMLETTRRGLQLYPIPAEGVIIMLGTQKQREVMRADIYDKCSDMSYANRLLNEAKGCFEIQMKQGQEQQ